MIWDDPFNEMRLLITVGLGLIDWKLTCADLAKLLVKLEPPAGTAQAA